MEIVLLWFLFGIFSAVIASGKNRSGFGWFFVGLVFGPFGLVVAFLPANEEDPLTGIAYSVTTCPFCAEEIKYAAVVCKHCGRDLPG